MYPLKQSTAITVPFFAHSDNGDGVPGIADGSFTKRISKDGGAFAAMTVTVTEMENGFYSLPLSTAHTDTTGILTISLSTSAKRVNLQFRVHARLPDDHAFPVVSGRGIDVDATGGAEITANQSVNVAQWLGSAPSALIAGRVDANAQVVGDKTGYALTTGEEDAIVNKVWDETTAEARTAGTYGQLLKDNVNATISSRASQTSVDAVQADTDNIQTRLPAALVSGRMDSNAQVVADKTGYALTSGEEDAIVNKVWDETTAEVRTAGTYGQLLKDNVNATISSRASQTSLDTVQADTDNIQTRLPAALVSGRMDSNAQVVADKTGYSLAADSVNAAALAADAVTEIADGILDRNMGTGTDSGSPTVRTVRQALRFNRNRFNIAGGTLSVYKEDDITVSWTGAVTTTAGNPVTQVDPA